MNRDLENLIHAYDAWLENPEPTQEQAYWRLLQQTLENSSKSPVPSLPKFHQAVVLAHARWVSKQASQPSHIPPRS